MDCLIIAITVFSKQSTNAPDADWIEVFTGLLVVVGFLQFGALIGQVIIYCRQAGIMRQQRNTMLRQWRAMRAQVAEIKEQTDVLEKSVKAAQDNATAAKASADALINAERPWITVTIRKDVKNVPYEKNGHVMPNVINPKTFFYFVLKNLGRIPAEIIAIRGAPEITDEGIDGGLDPSEDPDYGHPAMLPHVKMLAPQEEWEYDQLLTLFHYPTDQRERIRVEKDHIIFTGVVLYRDALSPTVIHETRFCYTYLQGLDDYVPADRRSTPGTHSPSTTNSYLLPGLESFWHPSSSN